MKSIAFAEKFGNKGQFLETYIKGITNKYLKLSERLPEQYTKEKARQLAQNEINLVMNTIDGFFERYGNAQKGFSKGIAGVLATISNLNMLDRVTIASLGDLAQPFTNSNNYLSWFKGAVRTGFTNKRETGIAKDLLLDLDKKLNNEISNSLLKSSGVAQGAMDDATKAVNVMGKMGVNRKLNELAFKGLGLTWLTGLARRYAFNTGAIDAYGSARKLYKFVGNKNSLNSSKGLKLTRDVNRYNLDVQDALKLGKFNTFDEAVADKASRKFLSTAGILAANRDALIPQVSNRLLFTQSRNPWVRLMGQFTSWAMAKSTQTNKLLQRIENGDVRQLVKLVSALPVFGGIQMLREIAKHGEIKTDPSNEEGKWWAESIRLSGMGGILPELFIGRLTGPGSYRPWFLPFPAASIAIDAGDIGKDAFAGKTDKAMQKFMDRIFPLPTWRNWIGKLFDNVNISRPLEGTAIDAQTFKPQEFNIGGRVGFSEGDEVDVFSQFKVTEPTVDNQVSTMMEKEKVIIPPKKPIKTKENTVKEEDTFQKDLKLSESSGNYGVINTEGYMGAYQFGNDRLQDYKDATGEDFDNKNFVNNKELQDKVFKWHTDDIKSFVSSQKLNSYIGKKINGVPVTLNGLIAVAHLGGKEGMKKFLNSNGEYNPEDKYGTSLLDYLNKFK